MSSRTKQSPSLFIIFAFMGSALFLIMGIFMIIAHMREPQGNGFFPVAIFMCVLGILCFIGAIWGLKTFGNSNAGKMDANTVIYFEMDIDGNSQQLTQPLMIRDALANLPEGKELNVRLTPEFFGLVSWKFIKVKGNYISFPTIHKKDKYIQYFIMPNKNVEQALEPFMDVFFKRFAVDTSKLMDMKRYNAVMDYYGLH